jgi:hypothetical protein
MLGQWPVPASLCEPAQRVDLHKFHPDSVMMIPIRELSTTQPRSVMRVLAIRGLLSRRAQPGDDRPAQDRQSLPGEQES